MGKEDLSKFIDKAQTTSKVETPKQKVVPIKSNKRDQEQKFTLWIDKELLKKYKLLALEKETNVKELIVDAMKKYLG